VATSEKLPLPYRLVRGSFRILFKLLARVDAQGLERVPREGPVVMAANHTTIFEGPLLMALFPRHPLTALAKQEFRGTAVGKLLEAMGAVYVARGEVDRQALRELLRRLKAGGAVGLAPEGTRSKTGVLLKGKEGVAYLALQTDAWIVPVATWGQEKVISEWKRLRRPLLHLRVGEPFKIQPEPGKPRGQILEEATERIMTSLARLLPAEYRGYYADRVLDEPETT
jgi:1-acyl-sn-glycerol-3-phosphate acyltransferase